MSAREEKAPAARAARACDSCHGRGARWYCAADDAFLCNACDASVHSANPLARRHERVRLKPAREERPAWHHGCKRKARSPRGPHRGPRPGHDDAPVPDVLASPAAPAAEEAQLLYRVPVLDPVLAGFYSSPALDDDWKPPVFPAGMQPPAAGFPVQPDLDLLGFEIDVGSLLGDAIDGDAFCLEFLEQSESHGDSGSGGTFFPVKEEEMEDNEGSSAVTKSDVSFGCGGEELDEKPEIAAKRRRIMLSLNYDAVISAWSAQACPWADGARPQLDPDECWLDYTGMVWGTKVEGGQEEPVEACSGGGSRRANEYALVSSAGREARVSRYREKRRTRLFSKKIRYEVRKLNAEKRPRMKGRFVKRSSFAEGAASMPAARAQPQFAF